MSGPCDNLILRCLKPLDERVSVKLLLRVWGPRFEFVVRLILIATFLDDSFRTARDFSDHTKQVGEGYLKPLAATSPALVGAISTVVLAIGLLAQSLGALCLLALIKPDMATKALIGWAIAQPVLYAQLANVEFVAESISLVGGLLILRAHLSEQAKRDGRTVPLGGGGLCAPDASAESGIARTQLLGRLLLPAVYLYYVGLILRGWMRMITRSRRRGYAGIMLGGNGDSSLSMFAVDMAVLVGLVLCCTLVAAGLKSRTVALSLALVNFGFVCYMHPYFRFMWREGGEWKYDEAAMRKSMLHVSLPKDISQDDFEPWLVVDLHQYYFFQGLSTSGALLLLAQFGPGDLAVEKDEVLLSSVQSVGKD